MKKVNQEEAVPESTFFVEESPVETVRFDRDGEDDDLEFDEQEDDDLDSDDEGDWGDVDPAGGDAPSSPGSAV